MKKTGLHGENGQGLIEYSLLLVLVAINVILILLLTGTTIRDVFCRVVSTLGGAGVCSKPTHYAFDDFANLNGWTKAAGTWSTANGNLRGGGGEGRLFLNNFSGTDYSVTADLTTLTAGNGYGVFFRASNNSAVDGYSFQYDPGYSAFIFRKWARGNEFAPFAVAKPPAGFQWLNTTRQVQITVRGNTFTAYLDGQPVLTGSDSTYTQGGVGLRTWDSTTVSVGSVAVDPVP